MLRRQFSPSFQSHKCYQRSASNSFSTLHTQFWPKHAKLTSKTSKPLSCCSYSSCDAICCCAACSWSLGSSARKDLSRACADFRALPLKDTNSAFSVPDTCTCACESGSAHGNNAGRIGGRCSQFRAANSSDNSHIQPVHPSQHLKP